MMYHAWTFPTIKFTSSAEHKTRVNMGIFEPVGIAPVHQTLEPSVAGIPIIPVIPFTHSWWVNECVHV